MTVLSRRMTNPPPSMVSIVLANRLGVNACGEDGKPSSAKKKESEKAWTKPPENVSLKHRQKISRHKKRKKQKIPGCLFQGMTSIYEVMVLHLLSQLDAIAL